jgi:transposase-like protein
LDDAFDDPLDDEFPLGDGSADLDADVACPWCGEVVSVRLDPGSGEEQEYVEDCQVCCRPWLVRVTYDASGAAQVWADAAGDWDDD